MTAPHRAPTRGRPPRTDGQRAEQRARLIQGVLAAIREHGPDVSLVEMAAVAGVSKPVLYSEFGDKQGVADAVGVALAEQTEHDIVKTVLGDRSFDDVIAAGRIDTHAAITATVGVLIDLIDSEPQVYAFLVRNLRANDRGFLDNALVRVIHQRARFFFSLFPANVAPSDLEVVVDAAFGMALGAIESWQSSQAIPKERLVELLAGAMEAGLNSVLRDSPRQS